MESGGNLSLSSIKQENGTGEDDLPMAGADDSLAFMEPSVEIKAEPEAQPEFIGPDKIDVKYPFMTSVKLEKDPLSCDKECAKEIKEEDDDVQMNETPKDIPEIPFVSCGELLEPEWPSESHRNEGRSRDPALAGKKVFTCSECQSRFTRSSCFENHMRTHTGVKPLKPFPCTKCPIRFTRLSTLKIHMRSHTGERFTCEECQSSFLTLGHLNWHMKIHTGERPFTCTMCPSTFLRSSHLKDHVRSHTGKKPFACTVCESSFLRSTDLKIHMRIHTGEKPFACPECPRSFISSCHLHKHMRKHTGEKP